MKHLLFFLLICCFCSVLTAQDCTHPDVPALREIYSATGGANWANQAGWSNPDNCEPCTWTGVNCSDDRVTGLDFRDLGLAGTFPDVFDELPFLEEFFASGFGLRRALPASLLQHNTLRRLELERMSIFNTLPAEISGWQSLEVLTMTQTRLRDALPSNLFQLPALEIIRLSDNSLQGALPSPIAATSTLREVSLDNNRLSGCYPTNLGALAEQLDILALAGNGQLPWLGDWERALAGDEQVGAPCQAANGIGGTISEDCNCVSVFDFCGNITAQRLLRLYTQLDGDNWVNNDGWAGAVAEERCNYCDWYGVECNGNGQITNLDLSDNGLSGDVSAGLLSILVFGNYDLSGNNLTGTLSSNITAVLRNLQRLDWSNNQLSGPLPDNMFRDLIITVSDFNLSDNLLVGCIPEDVRTECNNPNRSIDLSDNPGLAFGGELDAFCASEVQVGASCQLPGTDVSGTIDAECNCVAPGSFTTTISGRVVTPVAETPLVGARVRVTGSDNQGPPVAMTTADGRFLLEPFVFAGTQPTAVAELPEDIYRNPRLGVSTLDVLLLRMHVLGIQPLDATQQVAADLNGDGQIDVADVAILQKILLGFPVSQEDPVLNEGWWRLRTLPFVPLPENGTDPVDRDVTIQAIKLGDLNFSY